MSKIVKIAQGQSLFDIAIQYYGTTDAISLLIEDNPALDITSIELAGTQVQIRDPVPALAITNKQVVYNYRNKKDILSPATLYPVTNKDV